MPTPKQAIRDTLYPVQAAAQRWEAAKSFAANEFNTLAEQQKMIDDLALRRQQYGDTIRDRSGNDAFLMSAAMRNASIQPPTPGKAASGPSDFEKALGDFKSRVKVGAGLAAGTTPVMLIEEANKKVKTAEDFQELRAAVRAVNPTFNLLPPSVNLPTRADVEKQRKALQGAELAAYEQKMGLSSQLEGLAENLGARGFEGGKQAQAWFEGLAPEDQNLISRYAQALVNDGKVSEDEMGGPEDLGKAAELYSQAKSRKAYRRQDRASYDDKYLELLQKEAEAGQELASSKARLHNKTAETRALELYQKGSAPDGEIDPLTGLSVQAAAQIPPMLRSIQAELAAKLTAFEQEDDSDDFDGWANSKLVGASRKGYVTGRAMLAAGRTAAEVQAELSRNMPSDAVRDVMATLAAADVVRMHKEAPVVSGTDQGVRQQIKDADDRAAAKSAEAAQEAQQALLDRVLKQRARALADKMLSAGMSGSDILTPSSQDSSPPVAQSAAETVLGPTGTPIEAPPLTSAPAPAAAVKTPFLSDADHEAAVQALLSRTGMDAEVARRVADFAQPPAPAPAPPAPAPAPAPTPAPYRPAPRPPPRPAPATPPAPRPAPAPPPAGSKKPSEILREQMEAIKPRVGEDAVAMKQYLALKKQVQQLEAQGR